MGANYSPTIVTDNLVMYLDAINDRSYPGSGTTWYDLWIQNNDATNYNSATFTTDHFSVNGSTQYFQGPIIQPTNFTLSGILKPTAAGTNTDGGAWIASEVDLYWNGKNTISYMSTYHWNDERILFGIEQNGNVVSTTNGSVPRNTTVVVDCVYDGSNRTIYLNGVEAATSAWTTNPIYPTSYNRNIQIGRWGYSGDGGAYRRYFAGDIYQIKVYDVGLTASQIKQNFIAVRGRYGL